MESDKAIMKMKFILFAMSVLCLTGCGEKNHIVSLSEKSNVVDASDLVTEFNTDTVPIGSVAVLKFSGDKLFIADVQSQDTIISVYDAMSRRFIGRMVKQGPGPDEVTIPGTFLFTDDAKKMLMFDHGQLRVVEYDVDSALHVDGYSPNFKQGISKGSFPSQYHYVNDTLGFGRSIKVHKDRKYTQSICRYNLSTGEISQFGDFPRDESEKSSVSVSSRNGIVVEAFANRDLMVLYDFDGNVVKEIQGPSYNSKADRTKTYYAGVMAADDYIFVNHADGKDYMDGIWGTCLEVYGMDGEYLKSIELGRPFYSMAYNPSTGEMVFAFDSDMQFGVVNVKDILDGKNLGYQRKNDGEEAASAQEPESNNDKVEMTEATEDDKSVAAPGNSGMRSQTPPIDFVAPPGIVLNSMNIGEHIAGEDVYKGICFQNKGNDTLWVAKAIPSNPAIEIEFTREWLQKDAIVGLNVKIPKNKIQGDINEYIDIYFDTYSQPKRLPIKGKIE